VGTRENAIRRFPSHPHPTVCVRAAEIDCSADNASKTVARRFQLRKSGGVVALTTQGAGAWSREWQSMPEYPLLWSQTLRHVLPGLHADGLSARVDHALSGNLLLFARFSDTPSSTAFGFSQANRVQLSDRSATLGLNAAISQSVSNEFRLNGTWTTGNSIWATSSCYSDPLLFGANAPCVSFYRFAVGGLEPLLVGSSAGNGQHLWSVVDTVGIRRGGHEIRMGIDYHHRLNVAETASFCQRMPMGTLDFIEEPIRDESQCPSQNQCRIPRALLSTISQSWGGSRAVPKYLIRR
jgi:hypothetical protein